jgi:hypothetical protein
MILKRFESPDEVRPFPRGRLELVTIGGVTIGRTTYEPGFKWSVDVSPSAGTSRCYLQHVGLVLEGRATVAFALVVGFLLIRMKWSGGSDFDVTGFLWFVTNGPRLVVLFFFLVLVGAAISYWIRSWRAGG